MSGPDLTAEMMNSFRSSGSEDHLTILLGAGASITSGLPDWDTFATRLLVGNGLISEGAARILLAHQDPIIVVEAARSVSKDSWETKLSKALYGGVASLDSLDSSPLHLAAAGRFLNKPEKTSLVTLNFDTLLERTIDSDGGEKTLSLTNGRQAEGKPAVHHLHGIITPDCTQDVVLTLTDFTTLIAQQSAWQVQFLHDVMEKGALIIAGTSYRDPDLRQWLHAALQENPGHKAFVLLARESFGVSKGEFEQLKGALSAQWMAIGLEPILLEDHTDAAQIIYEIGHLDQENYLSPQERSRKVWDAHCEKFNDLQEEYVEQLAKDAEALKTYFDVKELNITLWISDGRGSLVKWASQDRIYRDPTTLRRVETGHDSPWFAGLALGAEALVFQNLDDTRTRRWLSVLAIPLPVITHPDLPSVTSAVLTVGLPHAAEQFEHDRITWGNAVARIANEWGTRLSESAT